MAKSITREKLEEAGRRETAKAIRKLKPPKPTGVVYCSGPLFCPEEVAAMSAISEALQRAGFGTFLPHRDGLEAFVMRFANTPLDTDLLSSRGVIDKAIFALDVYQIVERCEYFVINLNGRVPDEGAVVEAGIAYAAGKPIVAYKDDIRAPFGGRDNSMLLGLITETVDSIEGISKALKKIERRRRKAKVQHETPALSVQLQHTVRTGRMIASTLSRIPAPKQHAERLVKDLTHLIVEAAASAVEP